MGRDYRAKIFKSGNSVALRLPKALGFVEGTEVTLREEAGGGYSIVPAADPEKIDISGFWGKAPWLKPIKPEDRVFEDRELDWEGRLLDRNG